jgi:hypothetical protein
MGRMAKWNIFAANSLLYTPSEKQKIIIYIYIDINLNSLWFCNALTNLLKIYHSMRSHHMDERIKRTAKKINEIMPDSLLDIGCRSCELKSIIDDSIEYEGCDIFQNSQNSVQHVGDFMAIDFQKSYECVAALDVIEHVDDPYSLMDKIFELSSSSVIASLPNVYSLTHKIDFCMSSTLGQKYRFRVSNSQDRHRWLMNCDEGISFFEHYSKKYNKTLTIIRLGIDESCSSQIAKIRTKLLKPFFSKNTMTRTILAIFK